MFACGPSTNSFAGKHKVCSKPSTLSIEGFDSLYPLQSNVCVSRENCQDALLSIEADSRKDGKSLFPVRSDNIGRVGNASADS